jgi:HEAT repeat protein
MIDDIDLSDSTLRYILWEALKLYSTEDLCKLTKDDDYIVRTAAAKQLQLRPSPKVFDFSIELCNSDFESDKEIGAFILGQLGTPELPFKKESLIALKRLLNDQSVDVRSAAIAACGHLGNTGIIKDEIIINGILGSINDLNKEVRISCAFAICSLNPTKTVINALKILLNDGDSDVVEWAEFSKEIIETRKASK